MTTELAAPLHPYDELVSHGNGLYTLDGRWKKSPLGRRMTVVRSTSGELAIHSAIRLKDADYACMLDPVGPVTLILVPSSAHADEARYYAERYPQAKVLVPQPVRDKCAAKLPRVDGTYADPLPGGWRGELHALQTEGTKMGEALFWHPASGTMIATDLVIYFPEGSLSGFFRIFMTWNGVVGRVGASRIFRWFFLADRESFARSLAPVKTWTFERIVMSHGSIVERDGKRQFLEGYASLGV